MGSAPPRSAVSSAAPTWSASVTTTGRAASERAAPDGGWSRKRLWNRPLWKTRSSSSPPGKTSRSRSGAGGPGNGAALRQTRRVPELSARLAERLPDAEIVAVDMDPLRLELGRTHHAGVARYVDAVIGTDGWTDALALQRPLDAVVLTIALHYLAESTLLAQVARATGGFCPVRKKRAWPMWRPGSGRVPRPARR